MRLTATDPTVRPNFRAIFSSRSVPSSATAAGVHPPFSGVHHGPHHCFWFLRLAASEAASGHDAKPFHAEWAADLLGQCRSAGTAYFLKQLGSAAHLDGRRLKLRDGHGGDWGECPEALRVREMPRAARAG